MGEMSSPSHQNVASDPIDTRLGNLTGQSIYGGGLRMWEEGFGLGKQDPMNTLIVLSVTGEHSMNKTASRHLTGSMCSQSDCM